MGYENAPVRTLLVLRRQRAAAAEVGNPHAVSVFSAASALPADAGGTTPSHDALMTVGQVFDEHMKAAGLSGGILAGLQWLITNWATVLADVETVLKLLGIPIPAA